MSLIVRPIENPKRKSCVFKSEILDMFSLNYYNHHKLFQKEGCILTSLTSILSAHTHSETLELT